MYKQYILNIILFVLPPSRLFAIKRFLAIWAGIDVGDGVCINGFTRFHGKGEVGIGSNTWVGVSNSFYRTESSVIRIGKDCGIGPEVAFITGSHEIGGKDRRAGEGVSGDIVIEDGCWIGARVTILGGVTISRGSIIAAGAVVCSDVKENAVYAGVPAVFKRSLSGT